MTTPIKGFKVFNPDWTCRGFQYEIGKTFEENVTPETCNTGFHFCRKAVDCFDYYSFVPENKVAEVIALGETVEDGDKCATNKIQIVREIPWHELLELVNLGKGNTGYSNSGNRNSGDGNSGDGNSGNRNSGNWNSGDGNSGDDGNSGNWNSGDGNSGDGNSGDRNSGDGNSGNWNSGNRNSGDGNSGNRNSGDGNSGDGNSGNWNSGDWNSGDWNQGDHNTGDFNISDHNTGCFNQEIHKIKIFDLDSELTYDQWRRSDAYRLLNRINVIPTTWICEEDMTDEEKKAHPKYETTRGYLRENDTTKAYQNWWSELDDEEKEIIKDIPNFDATKFQSITGINVEGE